MGATGPTGHTAPTEEAVRAALADIPDPCMASAAIDLSVLDLGLVREVRVEGAAVHVELTFTELGCGYTHHLVTAVEERVRAVDGVETVEVTPVWAPMWSRDDLSERARHALAASTGRLSTVPLSVRSRPHAGAPAGAPAD